MKSIIYFKVKFAEETSLLPGIKNANFEKWDDAVKYLQESMGKVKEYCAGRMAVERVISEYKRECPFEKEYSFTYQITTQDSDCFCRIYYGRVEKSKLPLN